MVVNNPATPPPPRPNQASPQTPVGYQYVFLSIVAAVLVVFVLFPGASLGVFYPPCVYAFPKPVQTATPVPAAGAPASSTPIPTETPTPTVTLTPSPSPTGTLTPGPPTAVPPPTPLPGALVTATAQAQVLILAGHLALEDDTVNYASYAHCLGNFNNFIDYTVKFLSIAAAVITTISATQGWRVIGFTSGALVTALTAFQTTFPIENRAAFYSSIAIQADSIVFETRYSDVNEQTLLQEHVAFDQMKASAAAGPVIRAVATQLPTASITVLVTITPTLTQTVTLTPATPGVTSSPTPQTPTVPPTVPTTP